MNPRPWAARPWAARLRTVVAALAIALVAAAEAQAEAPPAIAAASDLRFALDEVATAFTAETGQRLVISYGSSGNFLRQIVQGAPFELFLSADERFVFELAERGRSEGTGTLYAIGRLVLFAGTGSPVRVDAELADLAAAVADGRLRRLAIANPEHAPYGRAAEQVLRSQGLWDLVAPRLVLGENVSHAAQFATTGSAQAGIFAYALALAPAVSARGSYVTIPSAWHEPLRQRMVLLDGAGPIARAFYAYLQTPAARAVLQAYGFGLPTEAD